MLPEEERNAAVSVPPPPTWSVSVEVVPVTTIGRSNATTTSIVSPQRGAEPERTRSTQSASVSAASAPEKALPPSAAPPVASVIPVASAPVPEHIELTIQEAPPATAVFLGALKLGSAPGPLRLKRGDAPLKLTLKAPGYTPQTIEFVPAASGSLEAKLSKVRGPGKPGPGNGAGELERPY